MAEPEPNYSKDGSGRNYKPMNPDSVQKHNRFLIFLLLAFAWPAIFFSAGNFKLNEAARYEVEQRRETEQALDQLELSAYAVAVYDFTENRKVYGKNDGRPWPVASLVKTLTAVSALGKLREEGMAGVSSDALRQSGDYGLRVGERWRAADLAKLTLLASSNDGAYALAESAGPSIEKFLNEINLKARRIGMENALFASVTGLDWMENGRPVAATGFASAEDLNTLAYYALRAYPEVMEATTLSEVALESISGFSYNFKNTNVVAAQIPNLLFSKTGFTDLAGGNLTIIFKNASGNILAVTLLGSTLEGRFTDMEKIVKVLYK